MRRRQPQPVREAYWSQVRSTMRCAFGHDVERGGWVRWGRHGAVTCESCCWQRWKLLRPEPVPVVGEDVRMRRAGDA